MKIRSPAMRLHPSSFRLHPSRKAFTFVELLVVIAALVIGLALMIELAHYVRDRSAEHLTRDLLVRLATAMERYAQRHDGAYPALPAVPAGPDTEESVIQQQALVNNQSCVRALRVIGANTWPELRDLPVSVYDHRSLRDAWGTPILCLPPDTGGIQPRGFCVSAGPDRKFSTREDNLYSYE